MATHPNILAWKPPWTEEPGRLVLWVTKSILSHTQLHSVLKNCEQCKVYSLSFIGKYEIINNKS